jgi:hypothetical protein
MMPIKQPAQGVTYGPVLFAVVAWLFAGSEIYERAAIELNGTVVSSETSCMQPANNRCATQYIVEAPGQLRQTYIAGPTDKALPRRLPVGTVINKDKWQLSYSINGREVNDFPVVFYSTILMLGLMCAVWGYTILRRNR